MGVYSYGYKAIKAGATKLAQKLSGQGKTTGKEGIKSLKPNVPVTKSEKIQSKLAIAKQKTKGSKAKLDQAIFNLQEQNKAFKKARENKMGGGMMGRRMGYSQGSSKGKIPTTPKEKSLAKLAPPKDRITFGDVVAGRTKGKA